MTDAEMIAELERLNAARTRAEWRWREEFVEQDGRPLRTLSPGVLIIDDMGGGPWGDGIDKTNAHFIVAAANAMPRLLALAKEAQAARAEAERLREVLLNWCQDAAARLETYVDLMGSGLIGNADQVRVTLIMPTLAALEGDCETLRRCFLCSAHIKWGEPVAYLADEDGDDAEMICAVCAHGDAPYRNDPIDVDRAIARARAALQEQRDE